MVFCGTVLGMVSGPQYSSGANRRSAGACTRIAGLLCSPSVKGIPLNEKPLFLQNVIAIIWDFDKTLSPSYMQKPIFDAYAIDEEAFWKEVRALPEYYARAGIQVQEDTCYLTHLLSYVQHGVMPDLSNARLRELGSEIAFFPGLPGAFDKLKGVVAEPRFADAGIKIEHYVVSTGLHAMIEGSAAARHLDGIWASVFIEEPAAPGADLSGTPGSRPISQIAGFLDNTTKTRAIFEINKGVNKEPSIKVNDTIDEDKRRVPFSNMIYVADGPSDVPSFSVVRKHGGKAFAVYDETSDAGLKRVNRLQEQGRIHSYGPANYSEISQTFRWLKLTIVEIAEQILQTRGDALIKAVKRGPAHG